MDLLKKYFALGEDWAKLCERVSGIMQYRNERESVETALKKKFWLPNSPCLINAGRPGGRNLAACHLLHVPNSIYGIFETNKSCAEVFKSGGGIGLELSALSCEGTSLRYAPQGVASGPVSFMKVYDTTAQVVMEGGLRRAAIMATLNVKHDDILRFVRCKEEDGSLSNFNISVTMDDGPQGVPSEIWEVIVNHAHWNGEPGVVFLDNANRNNPTLNDFGRYIGCNACVTGDTLVAVADGRDTVPIGELAKQGKDVPLYCQGPDGIVVRMGRHPRKTGMKVPVLRVTLDDSSSIRVTPDHNFMLRDGTYRPAKDLQAGDNLMPIYKYQYVNRQAYWAIHLNAPSNHVAWAPEHRLIAEYQFDKKLRSPDYVVHHKDHDGLNNHWDNLEVLSADEHNQLHRNRMLGSNNPMRDGWWNLLSEEEKQVQLERRSKLFSGSNNPMFGRRHSEETKREIGRLAKARMTPERREYQGQMMREWFSIHGSDHLKGDRAEWVEVGCEQCGTIIRMTRAALDSRLGRNKFGKVFCSPLCVDLWRSENTDQSRYTLEQILKWGLEYLDKVGNLPTASGWEDWRNHNNLICSRETVRQYFRGFKAFRQAIQQHNHIVISVEPCGFADVYNITVDDYHNLAYITNSNDKTPSGYPRLSGIITKNCSEIFMYHAGSCVLGSLVLPNVIEQLGDWALLRKNTRLLTRFLNRVIDVNHYPLAAIAQQTRKVRRIGVGVMGWATLLKREGIPFVSDVALSLASDIARNIYEAADLESWELAKVDGGYLPGRRRNATVMAIAPTGHIARIAGVSHSIYADYTVGLGMSVEQHLDHVAAWQRWVDNAVSYTISFPNDAPVKVVDRAFRGAHERGLKAISVYRDGSREGQPCNVEGTCQI